MEVLKQKLSEHLTSNLLIDEIRNEKGETLLIHAIRANENLSMIKDVVQFLMEHNTDIDARDNRGRTPLIHTALRDLIEVGDMLLDNGAQLDAKTNSGHSAFDAARSRHFIKYISMLERHYKKRNK